MTQDKINNPTETQINKAHFPMLLKSLLEDIDITNKANICSGFKATGIVPFNPQKILKKLPDYEEQNNYSIDKALLDYLKSYRTSKPAQKVRNKKLNIAPGKSISSQEVQLLTSRKKSKLRKQTINQDQSEDQQPEENLGAEPAVTDAPYPNRKQKVTIMADVKLSPYNRAYGNLKNLSKIDKNLDIFESLIDKENLPIVHPEEELEYIDYENPVPSTSADNFIKFKPNNTIKKIIEDKRSDDSYSEADTYSLRDSSEDECFVPSGSETFEDNEEITQQETVEKCENSSIRVNSYVLVKFCGLKTEKYYVGKVLEMNDDSSMVIKFMRKRKEEFYWPDIDDVSFILKSDMEILLGDPREGRRGTLKFDCIDFSKYNVQ